MAFGAFGTTTAAPVEPAARRRSPIALFLLLPGILYLGLFFLVPLVSLVITSLQEPDPLIFGTFQNAFRWENYVAVLEQYWPQAVRSFGYAALATFFALLIGFPLAYFIGITLRRFPLLQALALVLVIAPFFISFLLRTLAWKQLFSDEGPVVGFLSALSILPEGAAITGSAFAVVFGITYNFIPFMTLPIYTSLERLDLRYVEAGGDLYASPASTFFRVTLPLAAPGIMSGTLLTFIPASGDYINASREFLGSTDTAMIGTVIEANFLVLQNFPAAASLSIILMAVILVLVSFYVKRSGTDDLL
ncbi:ABC transporter permease [Microcella daejeonensis]|uniref:ABC transporter permease n=1 Tax=Microcella daejeonensis TaxID=2994971 RepID=UPI00226DEE0E|nr:ABC transporter permease [Microcella daejeonensis]WAB83150.1 ABC transporter permease [Microcella daejeonensis]